MPLLEGAGVDVVRCVVADVAAGNDAGQSSRGAAEVKVGDSAASERARPADGVAGDRGLVAGHRDVAAVRDPTAGVAGGVPGNLAVAGQRHCSIAVDAAALEGAVATDRRLVV